MTVQVQVKKPPRGTRKQPKMANNESEGTNKGHAESVVSESQVRSP